MIKVYSTPSCGSCKTLKQFLKDNNIEFKEVDLSALSKEELDKTIDRLETLAVPVLEFDDAEIIRGFDLKLIKNKLNI